MILGRVVEHVGAVGCAASPETAHSMIGDDLSQRDQHIDHDLIAEGGVESGPVDMERGSVVCLERRLHLTRIEHTVQRGHDIFELGARQHLNQVGDGCKPPMYVLDLVIGGLGARAYWVSTRICRTRLPSG